jgi:hypothetical protein
MAIRRHIMGFTKGSKPSTWWQGIVRRPEDPEVYRWIAIEIAIPVGVVIAGILTIWLAFELWWQV